MPRRNKTVPHERYSHRDTCKSKKRFPNQATALRSAEVINLSNPDIGLSVYKCELCGGWHLTNRNEAD